MNLNTRFFKKKLFVIALLFFPLFLFSKNANHLPITNCPTDLPGFTTLGEFENSKYFLSDDAAQWQAAQNIAVANGGNLASITSQAENDFILQNISEIIFIGFNDASEEGTFVWANGDDYDFNKFSDTNTVGNDFGKMNFWNGNWGVDGPFVARKYIVEIPCGSSGGFEITYDCPTEFPQNGIWEVPVTLTNNTANPSFPSFLALYLETYTSAPNPQLPFAQVLVPSIAAGASTTIILRANLLSINNYLPNKKTLPVTPSQFVELRDYYISWSPTVVQPTLPFDFYCKKYSTDLAVEILNPVPTINADNEVIYSVKVTNNGNEDAYNIQTQLLESIASFSNQIEYAAEISFLSQGSWQRLAGGDYVWLISQLSAGASATVDVVYRLDSPSEYGADVPTSLTVEVAVTSGHLQDTNAANNLASFTFTQESSGGCPASLAGFTALGEFGNSKYFISNDNAQPAAAQAVAAQNGGYLAVISDQAENDFLQQNISELAYIGLNDAFSEGNLFWVNGESFIYNNINPCDFCNENSAELDYVMMQFWDGAWSFSSQYNSRKYIVEVPCQSTSDIEITYDCPTEFPHSGAWSLPVTIKNNNASTVAAQELYLHQTYFNSEFPTFNELVGQVTVPELSAGESVSLIIENDLLELPYYFPNQLYVGLGLAVDNYEDYNLSFDFNGNENPRFIDFYCKKYETDLEIEIQNPTPTYGTDNTIRYTLAVTNNGAQTAYNIQAKIIEQILIYGSPPPYTYPVELLNMTQGMWERNVEGEILWYLEELGVGESATVEVIYPLDSPGQFTIIPEEFPLEVSVMSGHLEDTNISNNTNTFIFRKEEDGNCPNDIAGFTTLGEFGGSKYFLSNDIATPAVAQAIAAQNGGYLATISDQAENDFLQQNISEFAYLGLNDAFSEGNLVWRNGEPFSYNNINPCNFCDENSAELDYVMMQPWDGAWSFSSQYNSRKYIVEVPCGNTGVCICTTEFDPVCGSDGVTYSNSCLAECAGVFDYSAGACTQDCPDGLGWTLQFSNSSSSGFTLLSTHFINENEGWVAGGKFQEGRIYHTTDGGTTWTQQNPNVNHLLWSVYFTDENNGWAVGNSETIIHTDDGGQTWTTQKQGPSLSTLLDVFFVDAQTGWAVGVENLIYHTINGGMTWTTQTGNEGSDYQKVFFTNSQVGYIVGADQGFVSEFLKTIDGGQTWTRLPFGMGSSLRGLHFINENEGWILGFNGEIFHTTDGGQNFEELRTATLDIYLTLFFLDEQNGWIGRTDGSIFQTQDGGKTWLQQPSTSFSSILYDIHFTNIKTGWAIGNYGNILHFDEITPDFSDYQLLGELEGHQYYLSTETAAWDLAQNKAVEIGGHLVTINDQAENDFLQQNISEMAYIGLTDAALEGTPNWINGEAVNFTNFDVCDFCNENSEGLDAVLLQNWNGGWSWSSINNPRKYIVEVPCVSNNVTPNLPNTLIAKISLDDEKKFLQLQKVYPNPTMTDVRISVFSPEEKVVEVQILDARGLLQKVETVSLVAGKNEIELATAELRGGIYSIFIPEAQGKHRVLKFVKMRD